MGEPFDRRAGGDRRREERRTRDVPVPVDRRSGGDRRQGERRRNVNAYEMTADELEFANALARHRERSQNRFPTAREILRILRDLGYERREPPGAP